jgi:hypothetical protein
MKREFGQNGAWWRVAMKAVFQRDILKSRRLGNSSRPGGAPADGPGLLPVPCRLINTLAASR